MSEENFSRITCADARNYDMVAYLSTLGIEPARIKGNNYWYHSPLREEKTPSFKINRKLNRWFDFGDGIGGNLIDFAIRYNNCTVKDFLLMLQTGNATFRKQDDHLKPKPDDLPITILSDHVLTSHALLNYLTERGIPYDIAEKYCSEVRYQVGVKIYYAIGFKNDSGGYELRNKYFKGSSSPKDFTTILSGAKEVSVLEGFFDFLSYLVLKPLNQDMDFVILNSLAMFEKARSAMEQYEVIHLFLDNNKAGKKCLRYAKSISRRYIDESQLYPNCEDLNDFLNLKP
ncbi:MAG: toprim domain-containing protein [Candidatus Pedobacter colombiensis]|uniref:Toprim domain-containing protein n=1 Tax=Candidatus Pedobacter colombiensis TaxID=3121371 RepID=A0AAJ6B8W7_9SPHI|nr:toprim domain-containing protein [Pedobacter sp.]WEK21319.1 MAG: toprim domain-containing protein [Pedobacter sp.]